MVEKHPLLERAHEAPESPGVYQWADGNGKVLYVGISDAPAWVVAQANTLASLKGWSPFVGLQVEYSLIERSIERELLPMARSLGIGITPWAPLGGGVLTGKYSRGGDMDTKRAEGNQRRLTEQNLAIAKQVDAIGSTSFLELQAAPGPDAGLLRSDHVERSPS